MRLIIQRVANAAVAVDGKTIASIDAGLLVLVCAMPTDTEKIVTKLAHKVANLRIFSDAGGKLNLSLLATTKQCLVVSQFTLAADTRKGNRPSFTAAATGEQAVELCHCFCAALEQLGIEVRTGEFGADMQVSLVNDGPVTIYLDSEN